MAYGKSVQLYLVDGTPGGLIIAEILSWTGKIMACPRSNLESLLKRDEVAGTGVYILLGDDPDDPGQPTAYIGETDEVKKRLIQHNKGKDDWNRVITITSKDLNMTKAHVRYLEHRLIAKATDARRARLQNANSAVLSILPEAAQSDMEQFLEQVELILPLLNVNILRKPATSAKPFADRSRLDEARFEFRLPKYGVTALAREMDGEFVVLAGSEARLTRSNYHQKGEKLRIKLEADGVIVKSPELTKMIFTQDYAFGSPSAAGGVVSGRSTNGRVEWKVRGTGQSYGDWQQSKAESAEKACSSSDAPVPLGSEP